MDYTDDQMNGNFSEPPPSPGTKKHLLFLAKTWDFTGDGGLSSTNKEMAVQFAKNEEVQVSCLVAYTNKDLHNKAKDHNVHLVSARCLNGFSSIDCLSFPPDSVTDVDAIIGYGEVVGRHAQPIKILKYTNSKWVHITCLSSEVENKDETHFCEDSDLMIAIGSNVAEVCERQLRFCGKKAHTFIPGIFKEFWMREQSDDGNSTFTVITFYPSLTELTVGGERYSIPARAVGMLPGDKFQLLSVCAPHDNPDEVKEILHKHGIQFSQFIVRSHCKSLDSCWKTLVEADLLILPFLPSKSESFGLIALQAISAGLPILVTQDSGLGQALKKVPYGDSYVVNSDKPEDWARHIVTVKDKKRKLRLSEARLMRESYDKTYLWKEQCDVILDKILQLLKK